MTDSICFSTFVKAKKRITTTVVLLGFMVPLLFAYIPAVQARSSPPHLPPRKPDLRALYPGKFLAPPTLVSRSDAKTAKKIYATLDRNRFKDAKKLMRKIRDPFLERLLQWNYLIVKRSPASFKNIKAFLDRQSDQGEDWPKRKTLLMRAEEKMPNMPAQDVLAWFQTMGGPFSTQGRVRKAQAQYKLNRNNVAVSALRKIWVKGNFSKSQEKRFYRRYKKLFTTSDQAVRLERLIWEERFWPARRQIWKVDEATRKLAVARLWLMRREGNVDKAIKNLSKTAPQLINNGGLIYERVRWRRRKGRNKDAAALFNEFQGDPIRPDKWWTERAIIARSFLQDGKPREAYRVTSHHNLSADQAAEYSDAEWLSGWIQLRFLKNPKRALVHFINMLKAVNYPISLARGAYWAGRAALALGDINAARRWLTQAAGYPTTYYGQLAAARLGHGIRPFSKISIMPSAKTKAEFKANPNRRAAQILAEIGENQRIRPFIIHLADAHTTSAWQSLTANFANRYGRPDLAISVAKASARKGMPLGSISYPALTPPRHKALNDPVETPLVLAVIRQESAFYFNAKSHVGARGLMQVMPATAKRVARKNRLPYDRERLTKDPTYNLIIGQVYLSDMVGKYEGSYPMALAAYNAGPRRVNRWIRIFGDPRKDNIDTIDWIEMIPYVETRNYVQRVLENLGVYRAKLNTEQAQLN